MSTKETKKLQLPLQLPLSLGKKSSRRRVKKVEKIKNIKDTLKSIRNEHITLEEFVNLVAGHTNDKGHLLRIVMTEDMNAFRKTVSQVYDTMTQDISDVLANEQMELARMHAERQKSYINRIMEALQELKNIVPTFDFKDYYENPEHYLSRLFKLYFEEPDEGDLMAAKRQVTYHRLHWMKCEGERLRAENEKLMERLNELKQAQRDEIRSAVRKEMEAEEKNRQLEVANKQLQEKFDALNEAIHETFLIGEKIHQSKKQKNLLEHRRLLRAKKREMEQEKIEEEVAPKVDWKILAASEIELGKINLEEKAEGNRLKLAESRMSSVRVNISQSQTTWDSKFKCYPCSDAKPVRPRQRPPKNVEPSPSPRVSGTKFAAFL